MNRDAEYTEVLRGRLTEKRFVHSLNVAESAKELALIYGCDPEKAYTVGLIHDCCKDEPAGLQLSYMIENGVELSEWEINAPKLYHAMCGKVYALKEFGVTDEDMLNAVRYHTTGRKKAKRSLDEAIVEGLSFTIKDLIDGEKIVHPDTLDAYNDAVFNIQKIKAGESK